MSEEQILDDSRNHVVCVFEDRKQAEKARKQLSELGIPDGEIRQAQGDDDAQEVDTSPKWFADTDEDIQRYREQLKIGNTVISVPVSDGETREKVHAASNATTRD